MSNEQEIWRPGSFTKNFSWGPVASGLSQLHSVIRLGFEGVVEDVPRVDFRKRVEKSKRPDFIPLNFFLFNKIVNGVDYVIADELVFQAINYSHSSRFDKLALFAFNLSFAGTWIASKSYQRRPALWANAYIRERVFAQYKWDSRRVTSNDIEKFVSNDKRYKAKTARKLATNLNYLYKSGRLAEMPSENVERWWVDSLFLALDRIIEDRRIDGVDTADYEYAHLLARYHFLELTGLKSLEKDLAVGHLVHLYAACGSRDRFSRERVHQLIQDLPEEAGRFVANDARPRGAIHRTNPKILKSIPATCAMLAKYFANFEILSPDDMEEFDLAEFIQNGVRLALDDLRNKDIRPTMTAEELLKITRDK